MQSDEILENAWMRSHSRCECERAGHAHPGRCGKALVWTHQGKATTLGGWQVLRHGENRLGGWEAVNACEILCWRCYQASVAEQAPASPPAQGEASRAA